MKILNEFTVELLWVYAMELLQDFLVSSARILNRLLSRGITCGVIRRFSCGSSKAFFVETYTGFPDETSSGFAVEHTVIIQ